MRVLFLSYDGMTDPLGQSQVIPYLVGLSKLGVRSHVLSFEKPGRFGNQRASVVQQMEQGRLGWTPLVYHKTPPILSTLWDLLAMANAARRLHHQNAFELIHCRSYLPCLIGEKLQRRFHVPLLFDMRGFWADERVDAHIWNRENWLYAQIYRFFKRKERQFLIRADGVVTLTHAAKEEICGWDLPVPMNDKITVIPCCSDLQHFSQSNVDGPLKQSLQVKLGLEPADFVVAYLGSIGTWYALDEMLAFFARLQRRVERAKLLFITPDANGGIIEKAEKLGVPNHRLCFYHASRSEVPTALALARLGLCFIKPFYSKRGSSPTKFGEYLSMGLPVVSNKGVGDSEWLARFQTGPLVDGFDDSSYDLALDQLPSFLARPTDHYRSVAEECFSLETGIQRYAALYRRVPPVEVGGELSR